MKYPRTLGKQIFMHVTENQKNKNIIKIIIIYAHIYKKLKKNILLFYYYIKYILDNNNYE